MNLYFEWTLKNSKQGKFIPESMANPLQNAGQINYTIQQVKG
jgi:hypothetical protein